ncbi:3-hydroxyanthranilate 3,4-dioxygenase [Anomaloglossus baeobatrachus]|uniref:3-hydroxyanthranilate 3,4-dioxygenase n=1 Tax=Anomaloglossus baeobatrachus TaxID=238106 RepID=UPI003F4FA136
MEMQPINVKKWIQENRTYFLPPVCNKLMHNNQLTVMFVGGPNQRNDYHIEEGEELFYQLEGDMCLKIIENGEHKDIHIKEGEMFLLPARIPHSPQRFSNTVGLVFERRRSEEEKDGLRFYVENTTEVLFEKWFHCKDLGVELAPIIKEYFNSKQYKTGKPDPDQIPAEIPFKLNTEKVMEPFSFQNWLDAHCLGIGKQKHVPMFENRYETKALVYGAGETVESTSHTDTWIWQMEGSSAVAVGEKVLTLATGDSLLLPKQSTFSWKRHEGCVAFCIRMEPAQRKAYN